MYTYIYLYIYVYMYVYIPIYIWYVYFSIFEGIIGKMKSKYDILCIFEYILCIFVKSRPSIPII